MTLKELFSVIRRQQSFILLLSGCLFLVLGWYEPNETASNIFLGIMTGLWSALLVHWIIPGGLSDLIKQINDLKKSVTKSSEQSIHIIANERDKLEKGEFYDRHYLNANRIFMTGIALEKFVKELTRYQDTDPPDVIKELYNKEPNLLQQLKQRPLHIEALLMDPLSNFVEERKNTEKNPNIIKNIENSIVRLKQLQTDLTTLDSEYQSFKGSLVVKQSSNTLYFSAFHVEYDFSIPTTDRTNVLFLGMLFPTEWGMRCPMLSIYDTGNQQGLYKECRVAFALQFEKTDTIIIEWPTR